MGKYKKLFVNSGIFSIANMGSSLISFVFVRYYTELLSSEQYGTIDILTTTTSLLIPLFTVAIVEAVFRFSMDYENKSAILSNGLTVALIGNFIFMIIGPIIMGFTVYSNYSGWLIALILFTSMSSICAQFVRGINKVKIFAVNGIIKTLTLVAGNILFLLGFHLQVEGYLLSLIMSELISLIFLFISASLYKYIKIGISQSLIKSMLTYSAPLIISSLSWWVMNATDKYIILIYVGAASNGVYAVAHKIPTVINLLSGLFMQAWQLSAIEEAERQDKNEFYTNVFKCFSISIMIAASILIFAIKPIMSILVAHSYGAVWRYSPFLIIAMVLSALSSFLGTNYNAMKKTGGALKTTLLGAILNLILNMCLIQKYKLNGAAFATMVSFMFMWLARAYDTRNFVKIRYSWFRLGIGFLILLVQANLVISGVAWATIPHIICIAGMLGMNRKEISCMIKRLIYVCKA